MIGYHCRKTWAPYTHGLGSAEGNLMPINATYYVTKKKSIITQDYSIGQDKLTVVPSHPYLGIEIDNKLSWKQQIRRKKNLRIRASAHLT